MSVCVYYFWKAFVFAQAPSAGTEEKIGLWFILQVQHGKDREKKERAYTDFFQLPLTCICCLCTIYTTLSVTILYKQARNNFITTPWYICAG